MRIIAAAFIGFLLCLSISDAFIIYVRNALYSNNVATLEFFPDASINDLAIAIFKQVAMIPSDDMMMKMEIRFGGEPLAIFDLPILHRSRILVCTSPGMELLSETGICSESVVEFDVSQYYKFKAFISRWTSPMLTYHIKEQKFEFEVKIGDQDFFGSIKRQLHSNCGYDGDDTVVMFAITNYRSLVRSNESQLLNIVREHKLWEFVMPIDGSVQFIGEKYAVHPSAKADSVNATVAIRQRLGFKLGIINQGVLLSQLMENESAYFCHQANDYLNFWSHRKGVRIRFAFPTENNLVFSSK